MLTLAADGNIEAQQKHAQGLADVTHQQASLLPLGNAENVDVHIGCGYTCRKRLAAWQQL